MAHRCAQLSAQAYAGPPEAALAADRHRGHWFVLLEQRTLYVVFRGTANLQDWMTDLQASRVPHNATGRVHYGFYDLHRSHVQRLTAIVHGRRLEFDDLVICGHSLGAALATLFAAEMPIVPWVHLFGSPRVGDAAFAKFYNGRLGQRSWAQFGERTFRHRNNCDVVTRVPPALPNLLVKHTPLTAFSSGGYRHVGREVYFDVCGRRRFQMPLWDRLRDCLQGRLSDLGKPGTKGVKDHSITRYVELCASHL